MPFPSEKDPRWEDFTRNDPAFFEELAGRIAFRPEVPEEVADRFELIRKLLRYSYYEYEFQDAAMDRALLTFELALKARYEELDGTPVRENEMNLYSLIRWGAKQGLFEESEKRVQATRKMRNHIAHPKRNPLHGMLGPSAIYRIVDLINGLYADPELRAERKEVADKWNNRFEELTGHGAMLKTNGEEVPIFEARVLAYDNRREEDRYYLLFWPLFELPEEGAEEYFIPEPPVEVAEEIRSSGAKLRVDLENGEVLTLTPISEEDAQERVRQWREKLENRPSVEGHVRHDTGMRRQSVRREMLQP